MKMKAADTPRQCTMSHGRPPAALAAPHARRAARRGASSSHTLDIPYDGRFTFVRLRWGGGTTQSRSWSSAWNHDYPRAEQHLSQILRELTYLDIHTVGSRILSLDDPDLFRYPIALMWEPASTT
ncbi:MAG: hypothetical protein DMG02_21475 [Acidobacteria bacterium]|nr:MAG: hypothetical protein DMG02_21475 [Acidobacteriota bacterium]